MNTLLRLISINRKNSKNRKVFALCTAVFFAWSFVSSLIYADGNRAEFNRELSGEKQSGNYDKLSGKNNGTGGETKNVTSGQGSASGSVASGSVSGSTAGGAASGTASGSVLSGSVEGNYSVDQTKNGIGASANASAKGTVVEGTASGQANTSLGPVKAGAQGTVTGSVGGQAQAGGKASVSTSGFTLEGNAGASAAAQISGEGSCTASCFGVSVTAKAEGDLRAGASAEAHGIISIDGGKVTFGGKIAGALGVGGGIGGSITIDTSELIDNVKGWFKSWFTPEAEPNPPPQTPLPAPDNMTTNFSAFDAIHGATPTAVLDGGGISSRDMGSGISSAGAKPEADGYKTDCDH